MTDPKAVDTTDHGKTADVAKLNKAEQVASNTAANARDDASKQAPKSTKGKSDAAEADKTPSSKGKSPAQIAADAVARPDANERKHDPDKTVVVGSPESVTSAAAGKDDPEAKHEITVTDTRQGASVVVVVNGLRRDIPVGHPTKVTDGVLSALDGAGYKYIRS